MSNHRTARFQNTYQDLRDCFDFLESNGVYNTQETINNLSDTERDYALKLRELCKGYLELTENQEEND